MIHGGINSHMDQKNSYPSFHVPEGHPWLVQYSYYAADNEPQSVVQWIGVVVHRLVWSWLTVTIPDSRTFGAPHFPVQWVAFRTRSDARRFCSIWGGRIVNLTSTA
jgi:hypothetical protein